MEFQKKQVENVEAIQYVRQNEISAKEIADLLGEMLEDSDDTNEVLTLKIKGQLDVVANHGDFIILPNEGVFYSQDAVSFLEEYELAE